MMNLKNWFVAKTVTLTWTFAISKRVTHVCKKRQRDTFQYSVPNTNNIFRFHLQHCAGEPYRGDQRDSALCIDEELVCCPKVPRNKTLLCDQDDGFECTPSDVRNLKFVAEMYSKLSQNQLMFRSELRYVL